MTNEETDTALILEGELKRRVTEVLGQIVHNVVRREMQTQFAEQKSNMLMEISIAVGKMMRVMEEEGRNPLWEATPAEFGLTRDDLNTHALGRKEGEYSHKLDTAINTHSIGGSNAIREQTPTL
jgi:hypothetical protein